MLLISTRFINVRHIFNHYSFGFKVNECEPTQLAFTTFNFDTLDECLHRDDLRSVSGRDTGHY